MAHLQRFAAIRCAAAGLAYRLALLFYSMGFLGYSCNACALTLSGNGVQC